MRDHGSVRLVSLWVCQFVSGHRAFAYAHAFIAFGCNAPEQMFKKLLVPTGEDIESVGENKVDVEEPSGQVRSVTKHQIVDHRPIVQ
jgi:hypothetical protein